ncbi:hypothetical protein J2752_000460 [Halarchaeum rubridurum]|uniref:DUF8112 domain-containing protein n=1 Tax=Halarchaeum rubridurum TaxID=489911 RepID=A0A830FNE6_9EURY|nr:hypothetical protein [Halarchaeum rubridurum]MBP1953579.1 hypothetical protein [Halarchaeum rubridurum]GGM64225.1 hypothetical protein GCM10009017_12830 [Halarchaeum rubridurum]
MTNRANNPALGQILTGLPIRPGGHTDCTNCHQTVREGDPVGIYAHWGAEHGDWHITDVYCVDCRPRDFGLKRTRILGVPETLAHGRLAVMSDNHTQDAKLVAHSVTLRATSPANEGAHGHTITDD